MGCSPKCFRFYIYLCTHRPHESWLVLFRVLIASVFPRLLLHFIWVFCWAILWALYECCGSFAWGPQIHAIATEHPRWHCITLHTTGSATFQVGKAPRRRKTSDFFTIQHKSVQWSWMLAPSEGWQMLFLQSVRHTAYPGSHGQQRLYASHPDA